MKILKKIDFGLIAIILGIALGIYFLFFGNLEPGGDMIGGSGKLSPKYRIFK